MNKKHERKSTRDKKGWLIPYLMALDQLFYKRWEYWTKAIMTDKIPVEPIPQIPFANPMTYAEQRVKTNLKHCLDYGSPRHSNIFEKFIDWILWGFNRIERFPHIDEKTDDYWYRTFNLGLFYKEPADHLADLVTEYNGSHNGYVPTPAPVVELMVRMNFGDQSKAEHKRLRINDPCCGSGIMLLYASNYSLNLYGTDISPLLCKVAMVNAFIYVPWLAYRPKQTRLDRTEGIVEIKLPTGIKVPECQRCKGRQFILELTTDHTVRVTNGQVTLNQPTLSADLIAQRLTPENITCARCHRKNEKE